MRSVWAISIERLPTVYGSVDACKLGVQALSAFLEGTFHESGAE